MSLQTESNIFILKIFRNDPIRRYNVSEENYGVGYY